MFARFPKAIGLLMAFLLAPAASFAAQQPLLKPKFCFAGNCFPTLSQAEAELRANSGPYGALWTLDSVTHYDDSVAGGVVLSRKYIVRDQEASAAYKPGYRVGGSGPKEGICAAQSDPRDPNLCAEEAEGVAGLMAKYRAQAPDCIYSDERYEGGYGAPYVSVRDRGGYGMVDFVKYTGSESRYYRVLGLVPWVGCSQSQPARASADQGSEF